MKARFKSPAQCRPSYLSALFEIVLDRSTPHSRLIIIHSHSSTHHDKKNTEMIEACSKQERDEMHTNF
jgi:hypothetical protein